MRAGSSVVRFKQKMTDGLGGAYPKPVAEDQVSETAVHMAVFNGTAYITERDDKCSHGSL